MKKVAKKAKTGLMVLEGAVLGAAFGIAAGLLAGSKAGKKLGKQVKDASVDFYKYIAPQIKKVKKMGEAEYRAFIAEAVKRYNSEKKLSKKEVARLTKEAQESWNHLKDSASK